MAGETENLTDGAHLVIDALKLNGIDTLFGVVGIPITDLARLAQAEGLRYIGFRHEQPAGHAAGVSGFLTGKPGICLTVSAPGFLNGMVALANATTNGFPMILISGSSDRAIVDLQRGDYEELDQMNAAKPYAKAAYRVNRPEDIGLGVARAIRTAVSGRPGGVYLDLPADVISATIDAAAGKRSLIQVVDPAPRQLPAADAVARALALLAGAKRPLIVIGKGAAYSRAEDAIRQFVEATGIPFLPMSMGKGVLPDTHPQCAAAARSLALKEADVVLLLGARLNWLLGHGKSPEWAPDFQLIQVDIHAAEMDSNRRVAAPVVGDILSSVEAMLAGLPAAGVKPQTAWNDALDAHKAVNREKMEKHLAANPSPMDFFSAFGAIRKVVADKPDLYIVSEGANTLDIGRNLIDQHLPRHRLDVGTWGVMGVGLGNAIGAAVTTGKQVLAIEGDSAFGFSGMEVETICRYGLPVTLVVLNNGGIYKGDDHNRSGGSDPAPTVLDLKARYDQVIEAFGGRGYHVETPAALAEALAEALASGKPALINAVIDPHAGTESGHLTNLNPQSAVSHS
ncbi:oxalyl-CoA decarboxylase [Xanthobacter sediminis]|uniref:oxalyl-CoA decarboxylase n=1 Tax=Xanthobacter sediminis TaxID=3119926 RepID=UPI003729D0B3